jgi:thiamine pyrophosphokinase
MANQRAVIFANGTLPDVKSAQSILQPDDFWIAADGGSSHALACGRAPDVLIGDFDSVPEPVRDSLLRAGTKAQSYPSEKDETDLELALRFAMDAGYSDILILAALGGRIDQTLANLSLLGDPALQGRVVRIDDGVEEILRIEKQADVSGAPGDIVSLIPFGVPAEGVVTDGLQYPLRGETLFPFKTRGVSNRMLGKKAAISMERGVLLCIHTHSSAGS